MRSDDRRLIFEGVFFFYMRIYGFSFFFFFFCKVMGKKQKLGGGVKRPSGRKSREFVN